MNHKKITRRCLVRCSKARCIDSSMISGFLLCGVDERWRTGGNLHLGQTNKVYVRVCATKSLVLGLPPLGEGTPPPCPPPHGGRKPGVLVVTIFSHYRPSFRKLVGRDNSIRSWLCVTLWHQVVGAVEPCVAPALTSMQVAGCSSRTDKDLFLKYEAGRGCVGV